MEVIATCDYLFCSTKPAISWYNYSMNYKPLIETNPYLRNPKLYEKLLIINVGSSTAIELGSIPAPIAVILKTYHPHSTNYQFRKPFLRSVRPQI